jgi:hypothetical protein
VISSVLSTMTCRQHLQLNILELTIYSRTVLVPSISKYSLIFNASSAGAKSSFITIQAGRFIKVPAKIRAPLSRKSTQKVSSICCNTPFSVPKMARLLVISPWKLPPRGAFSYVGLQRFLLRVHNVSDLDTTVVCDRWIGYCIGFVWLGCIR